MRKSQQKKSINTALSTACYSLLAATANAQTQSDVETNNWFIDLGAMNYIEQDRNTGIALMANARRQMEDGDALSLQLEFDTLTGATPNGATASDVPQSFTMASGSSSYQVNANELPADDTHMDTRMAFSFLYESMLTNDLRLNFTSHISMEFDYLSFGSGAEFLQDFNQHTTTLLGGINFEYNRVHPVGGIPIALASMQAPGTLLPRGVASVSRRQSGIHLGINQVIDKNSLMQFKYAWSNASGYLADPYKLLSVIDNQNESSLGSTIDYVYEKRPNQREIQNIYLAYKHYLQGDVVDVSYRYYWDEWDINSHTVNVGYRYRLNERFYLRPHIRFYDQSAANFYRHSLNVNDSPDYASADFRLAEFKAYTIGFRFGKSLTQGREHSIGIEYYTQRGNSYPNSAVGLQKQQDLFPTLNTLILTWNYAYYW